MSTFWSIWIIVLTLTCLALVLWVLLANRKVAINDDEDPENRTTGHVYDGIEEFDNPLPRWWFNMFIISMIIAGIWLILYPGLGSFPGILGWTSTGELARHQEKAQTAYEKSYSVYRNMTVEELIHNNKAMKMGTRLFANNCAVCHGADGGGNFGFPNLTDKDWLYGGSAKAIKHTLLEGRAGNMPAWSGILSEAQIAQLSEYVLQKSGQDHNAEQATAGAPIFAQNCASCHGADAKGNIALGAPNLADDIWLYDGSRKGIVQTLRNGRSNVMPSQKDKLIDDKIHVLAAYIYSLSYDFE